MYFEILIVVVLTLVNGLLAMSEMAMVAARVARLRIMAEKGSRGAATALKLAENPGRFLSTVQIGITLVGVLSGAFSGATLGVRLSGTLVEMGLSPGLAETLGFGGVVVAITYLSLIVGELVPKQLALRDPEAMAARVAPMMNALATAGAPLVWLLEVSGRIVLKILRQDAASESSVTDEEVKLILSEAQTAGVMEVAETQMIAGVMRIADRSARGLMTPRHDVEIVDVSDSQQSIIRRFKETGRSRLPVRSGGQDNVIGVVSSRDFLDHRARPETISVAALVRPAPVVRDGLSALEVIEKLREAPEHMVFVYDEYGHFEGIVTAMDVLEAITGDFHDADDPELKVVTRSDGSLLVSGWMPVDEFADRIGITLKPGRSFDTVAGLVLDMTGRLPEVGEAVEIEGWKIEVVDLDGRRIDKLLVQQLASKAR